MVVAIPSIKKILRKIFPQPDDLLEKELRGCRSVLDLGCGCSSPLQYIKVPYSVGVELFEPYLKESKKKGIHDEYILADIRKVEFKPKSFDCVLALEVLEHLPKEEGYKLLEKMEGVARKKIVITTPNSFIPQEEYDANIFQIHRSGWTVDDLKKLGFRITGMRGLKYMRKERGELRGGPKALEMPLTALTHHVTSLYPKLAALLFAVKDLEKSSVSD